MGFQCHSSISGLELHRESPTCGRYGSVAVANIPTSTPFRTTIPTSTPFQRRWKESLYCSSKILFNANHLLPEAVQTGQALDRLLWRIYQLAIPFGHVGNCRRTASSNSLQRAAPSNFSSVHRSSKYSSTRNSSYQNKIRQVEP